MSNYQGVPSFIDGDVTGEDDREPKSSMRLLNAIKHAEKKLQKWQNKADRIDTLYANLSSWQEFYSTISIFDHEFNLFWASMEVVKPSIYSRPPIPVVTPAFKDRDPVVRAGSELLERAAMRGFSISDIDQVMLGVRDDLAIVARGVIWCTYESGKDAKPYKERVCIEHLDRKDFLHEPARKWADVGWVARRAWLTLKEAKARFKNKTEMVENASYGQHKDDRGEEVDATPKAGFWEIWSKIDNKVYWVTEGCDYILDEEEPFLKLKNFFPCPRPAYGTIERRSLVPVPDIVYIEYQLTSINTLTTRIHDLCENLVVYGLIPAGNDVGDAIHALMQDRESTSMFIPVPAAAFGSQNKFVEWMPIDMYANAILASVQARRELIGNVQEVLGIADIMRGETEAEETLGAQKLKAQYGSVRIRDKVSELVRIARDTAEIMSEIQADEFNFDTLLDMARMDFPKKSEIDKAVRDIKSSAEKELKALTDGLQQAQQDPQAAQQQLQQGQQQIIGKYQAMLEEEANKVTYEQVRDLLREQNTGFADFEIQTDSTIYPDEQAEKASRNEFMSVFAQSAQALAQMVATGKQGAEAAGVLLKFQIAPYRPGREVETAIDGWIESIMNMPPQQGNEEQAALVEAQNKLAEAEQMKAQAAIQNVQAKAAKDQAENERKMMELQQKAIDGQRKGEMELATTQAKLEEAQAKVLKTEADIRHVNAQIAAIFAKMNIDAKTVDLNEFKTITDVEFRAQDQQRQDVQTATQVEGQSFEQQQRLRGEDRSDRQQSMTEQQMQQEREE